MDKIALGQKIKLLRRGKGLSQADMENASGVSNRSIQQIESGEANPGIDALESIAGALNVSVVELLTIEPPPARARGKTPKASGAKQPPDFGEAADFLERYRGLSPQRRAVVAMLVYDDESYLSENPALSQAFAKILKG